LKLKIFEYYDLLRELIKRDLKRRYSESFLGFLWYIFEPLILMSILVFIFTTVFPSGIEKFAVFFLIGFMIFRLFNFGTSGALDSIVNNSNLIRTTYLPTEIFPITRIIVALISTLFDLIVVFIFIIIFGVPFQITFLFIPVILILAIFVTMGAGLILSALFVRWRDLNVIWMLVQNILFWLLPIVYPISFIPSDFKIFYTLNPLTLIIENLRAVIINGNLPNFFHLFYIFIAGMILMALGIFLFNRRKKTFAEEI